MATWVAFWTTVIEKGGPWALLAVFLLVVIYFGGRKLFGWIADKFFSQIVKLTESATLERKDMTNRYLESLEHREAEFLGAQQNVAEAIKASVAAQAQVANAIQVLATQNGLDHEKVQATLIKLTDILEAVSRKVLFLEEWHVRAGVPGVYDDALTDRIPAKGRKGGKTTRGGRR